MASFNRSATQVVSDLEVLISQAMMFNNPESFEDLEAKSSAYLEKHNFLMSCEKVNNLIVDLRQSVAYSVLGDLYGLKDFPFLGVISDEMSTDYIGENIIISGPEITVAEIPNIWDDIKIRLTRFVPSYNAYRTDDSIERTFDSSLLYGASGVSFTILTQGIRNANRVPIDMIDEEPYAGLAMASLSHMMALDALTTTGSINERHGIFKTEFDAISSHCYSLLDSIGLEPGLMFEFFDYLEELSDDNAYSHAMVHGGSRLEKHKTSNNSNSSIHSTIMNHYGLLPSEMIDLYEQEV